MSQIRQRRAANREPVERLGELRRILARVPQDGRLLLLVRRQEHSRFVVLAPKG